MKKRIIILGVFCALLFTGCNNSVNNGLDSNVEKNEDKIVSAESEEKQDITASDSVDNVGTNKLQILTAEDVELLASKHAELTIEDFAPYFDLSPLEEQGSLREMLEFEFEGEVFVLRVSASDKKIASASYAGALDGAVVFHKDFLNLTTLEEEYAYAGSCADIRSGNLEHIFSGTVQMKDYMIVQVPDGLSESDFKFWLGSRGGITFLREGETEEQMRLENTGFYAESQRAGGIEIWGVGELEQNVEVIKELPSLEINDVMLMRKEVSTDSGNVWYLAYTEKEGSSISYCFFLSEQEYSEEEFLAISETIQLMENAIY